MLCQISQSVVLPIQIRLLGIAIPVQIRGNSGRINLGAGITKPLQVREADGERAGARPDPVEGVIGAQVKLEF